MTRIATRFISAVLIAAAIVVPAAVVAGEEEVLDVSVIRLIADPERFHGRRVRVIGYCWLEFEGTALYVHEADLRQAIPMNGIWLDLAPDSSKAPSGRYAVFEGRFDAKGRGHMGAFSGSLTEITRAERWPSHAELRGVEPALPSTKKDRARTK